MITNIVSAFLSLALAIASAQGAPLPKCKITTAVEITATAVGSTLALAESGFRNCLVIQNKGSQIVYVTFAAGGGATEGIAIGAGGNWEPIVPFIDPVYVRSASGSQTVQIVSGR